MQMTKSQAQQPQNEHFLVRRRCQRFDVAGAAGRVRAAEGIVRAPNTDPPAAGPDRYRTTLSREHTREAARLEKELAAGIKISSVATDILGVSGRAMLA